MRHICELFPLHVRHDPCQRQSVGRAVRRGVGRGRLGGVIGGISSRLMAAEPHMHQRGTVRNDPDSRAEGRGEWLTQVTDLSPAAVRARLSRLDLLGRGLDAGGEVGAAKALERCFPPGFPCVALLTKSNGLLKVFGSASLISDIEGVQLVTAFHALFDESGDGFCDYLQPGGVVAMSMSGGAVNLGSRREWSVYEPDLVACSLTPQETRELGGALDVFVIDDEPITFLAYGYPGSANSQRHRLRPLELNGQRIGIYKQNPVPTRFKAPPEQHYFLAYDPSSALVVNVGFRRAVSFPRGISGGLVAGFFGSFACWAPVGVFAEWHPDPPTAVAARLANAFGHASVVRLE